MIVRELITRLRYAVDNSDLKQYENAAKEVGSRMSKIGALIGTAVAGVSIAAIAGIADEWASVEGRVSLVTDSLEEQKRVQESLFDLAQRNRQEYTATADLFQSVARNKKDLGLNTDQVLGLTDVIGKAMVIGGGSAGAQQAALMQLGQALGSGALRGDELNSIIEQAPRLAVMIADAFGVSVGQLKDLGKAGKITSKELADGLLKQAEKISAEFEKMPKTFSSSVTMLRNKMGQLIVRLNNASGAAEVFYRFINLLLDNFEKIAAVAGLIALRMGIAGATAALSEAIAAAGGLRKALLLAGKTLWPFLRLAAIMYGVYLIGQDIWVWLQGGKSVLGGLIGRVEEWQEEVAAVREFVASIVEFWRAHSKDLITTVAKWAAIGAVVLVALKVFGVIAVVIKVIAFVLLWVGGIMAAVFGIPVWAAVAIIAAIAAVAAAFYLHWDNIKKFASAAWDYVKDTGIAAFEAIKTFFSGMADWIGNKIAGIGHALKNLMPFFGKGLPSVSGASLQGRGAQMNQTNNVTVNATNASPAAVAGAVNTGIRRANSRPMMLTPPAEAAR